MGSICENIKSGESKFAIIVKTKNNLISFFEKIRLLYRLIWINIIPKTKAKFEIIANKLCICPVEVTFLQKASHG